MDLKKTENGWLVSEEGLKKLIDTGKHPKILKDDDDCADGSPFCCSVFRSEDDYMKQTICADSYSDAASQCAQIMVDGDYSGFQVSRGRCGG